MRKAMLLPSRPGQQSAVWGGAVSVLGHGLVLGALLLPPIGWLAAPSAPAPPGAEPMPTLTLMLVSQPNLQKGQSGPAQNQAPAAPPPSPSTPAAPVSNDAMASPPPPPPSPAQASVQPAAQPQTPEVNLGDGDTDSSALTVTSTVKPPGPDDRYRNQPPAYPREASRRGESGVVGLLIHVTPSGSAGLVETLASSGFPVLDAAARDAVARWHFTPAMQNGQPVESVYPIEFNFRKPTR